MTTATTAQPGTSTHPEAKTSYLVEVASRTTAWRTSFRWPTRRQANRCAKDFPHANVTVREVRGTMSFEGWKQVGVAA